MPTTCPWAGTVEAESESIGVRMAELAAAGFGAAIVDCVFDRQLAAIGRSALATQLSVGESGLGIGLAIALVERGEAAGATAASASPAIGGPIAMLSGSYSVAALG